MNSLISELTSRDSDPSVTSDIGRKTVSVNVHIFADIESQLGLYISPSETLEVSSEIRLFIFRPLDLSSWTKYGLEHLFKLHLRANF